MAQRPRSPNRLLRLLYRLPIAFYRLGLGWLLGHQLLLLTHRGRRSGKVRETVLEVVRHDRRTGECIVVSAYGERADWYRNIRAHPALAVQVGRERYVPVHRLLDAEEADAELASYERRHPWRAWSIPRALGLPWDGTAATRHRIAATVRVVSFRPAERAVS